LSQASSTKGFPATKITVSLQQLPIIWRASGHLRPELKLEVDMNPMKPHLRILRFFSNWHSVHIAGDNLMVRQGAAPGEGPNKFQTRPGIGDAEDLPVARCLSFEELKSREQLTGEGE
jgi:hypothetical protein